MTLHEAHEVLSYARMRARAGDMQAVRVCKIMRAECTRMESETPMRYK